MLLCIKCLKCRCARNRLSFATDSYCSLFFVSRILFNIHFAAIVKTHLSFSTCDITLTSSCHGGSSTGAVREHLHCDNALDQYTTQSRRSVNSQTHLSRWKTSPTVHPQHFSRFRRDSPGISVRNDASSSEPLIFSMIGKFNTPSLTSASNAASASGTSTRSF